MSVKEYFDANANPQEQGYVFVLMAERTKDVYEGYIKKAADALGFRCESFVDLKGPGDILGDILERIQKAEILIYDLTNFSPNVMWELGVGLTIKDADKVVVIREEGDEKVPFNIYSHRISYEYNAHDQISLEQLRETLIEVMRRINRSNMRDNPIKTHEVRRLLETASKLIDGKDWITAEVLFENMNSKEPENWYIFNQWGIMLRSKNEFQSAVTKFNQAIEWARFEDEKAYIYTELGILYQMNRKHDEAEDWFRKAERAADNSNKQLYVAWAEFHEELGDYFTAQNKINSVLGKLKESDSEYQEFKFRHEYYNTRINDASYKKSFEEYKREHRRNQRSPSYDRKEVDNRRPFAPRMRDVRVARDKSVIPYDISWEDLQKNFVGSVVEGTVSGVADFGVFVNLTGSFSGLIHWKSLKPGFEQHFAKNQPLKVKIQSALFDSRNGKERISLLLAD